MSIVLTFERFHQIVTLARKHFDPADPARALDLAIENELVGACAGFPADAAGEHLELLEELRLARRVHPIARRFARSGLHPDPREAFRHALDLVQIQALHAEDEDDPAVAAFYDDAGADEEPPRAIREESRIYLLHFEEPISEDHTAQHYVGSTNSLAARMQSHRLGHGVRYIQVAHERGIRFEVARVWLGPRTLEYRIKNRKSAPRLCPLCSASPQPVHYADELTPEQIADELIPF